MRISAGWAKGMVLSTPAGRGTRPTSGKVRAATLNMLAPYLEESRFLELFAGSGAMGLEAISRGARAAVFVEQAREALQCLRRNVADLNKRALAAQVDLNELSIVPLAVAAALPRLKGPFELIYIDPPYAQVEALAAGLMQAVAPLAAVDAVLGFETHAEAGATLAAAAAEGKAWSLMKAKRYGDTMISLFERTAAE